MHGGLVSARTNLSLVYLKLKDTSKALEHASLALVTLGWEANGMSQGTSD